MRLWIILTQLAALGTKKVLDRGSEKDEQNKPNRTVPEKQDDKFSRALGISLLFLFVGLLFPVLFPILFVIWILALLFSK
jgi:hypothetical protein